MVKKEIKQLAFLTMLFQLSKTLEDLCFGMEDNSELTSSYILNSIFSRVPSSQ
jgi:hypothetical protein